MNKILIVDDEYAILKTLFLLLKQEGYTPIEASDIAGAKRILDKEPIDLVITDLRLGDESGTDLLSHLRTTGSDAECIIMTAFGSIENAVESMRLGAFDYLTKPVNPVELTMRVRKAMEKRSLSDELERLRQELATRDKLADIVAESSQMKQVIELIHRIHNRNIPVLITGETGTGKEVVARSIYATSERSDQPFVAINCCTLPDELLDSELFGHVKGAFTGAIANRKGLFQQAHGGTLFLDEIGDVSLRLQSKLLRVLQEGELKPVGGGALEHVDVRIIAATNRDLEAMITSGEFRADLFFRLNVLPIRIPPLRERQEDISPLIDCFLQQLRRKQEYGELSLTPAARQKLMEYHYPGNIRELENIIERGFALSCSPVLDAPEIMFSHAQPSAVTDMEDTGALTLDEVSLQHVHRVMKAHNGNQVVAAKKLGISRSTLRRKLEQPN